jgi:hypothetical protein
MSCDVFILTSHQGGHLLKVCNFGQTDVLIPRKLNHPVGT